MTEEELENLAVAPQLGMGDVAIGEKHASLTVVVPSNKSASRLSIEEPSGSSVIDRPSPIERLSGNEPSVISDIGVGVSQGGRSERSLDKINNLVQKEVALGRVGVTREKAYRVIAQALDAMKWIDVTDEQGNIRREYVADIDKQRWGAEMAIKMFGDMIERKEIEHDVSDRTLDRFRAMSVADLKARAADLLLGKRTPIIDAEIVK